MAKKFLCIVLVVGLFIGLGSVSLAQDKVKLGTSVRTFHPNYLPPLTAEEKGFWKENGLDVEWVPFSGAVPAMQAVAGGAINIGSMPADTIMRAAERGLPVVMVSDLALSSSFNLYVRAESPYRDARDLKGTRIGVTTLGGGTHMVSRIIFSALGMEKDVRFVGAGGATEAVAGLRSGGFEVLSTRLGTVLDLKLQGILREVAAGSDYLPKPWIDTVMYARKDFGKGKPEVVRKELKAILQSTDFIQKNPRWTMDKMKSFQGVSEEAAKLLYEDTKFSATGRLDRQAVENARKVYVQYGILTEKAPSVDELFTNEYLPS